ncbi:MAG: hypothetical protein C5B52_12720 [Bacteroidetes bacterium]|nr:MAG: hypothetical protein C5B52_12720 [Bacteroidota bacterium]
MTKSSIYKAPPFIVEKLTRLLTLLKQEKRKYEQIAEGISDKEFRRTVICLAQESNQYACELSSQIHTLNGQMPIDRFPEEEEVLVMETEPSGNEKDVLFFCRESEKNMITAYREILNEPFLLEGVRKVIRYQLNGIMYAFLQLKLLSSTT